jgi:hypothetical protein
MNKRFKELAIEAGMIVGEANGFDMTRLMSREVKFAELIVQECLNAVTEIAATHDSRGLYNPYQMVSIATAAIEKRFYE